jgi:hypothetical protein
MEVFMSCPFCEMFLCYQRQIARRLDTDTFTMSEENAHRLVLMAGRIRRLTRTTLRRVDQEAVPIMLCDLFDGLAEGLMEGLAAKLVLSSQPRSQGAPSSASPTIDGEPKACPAG